MGKYAEFSRQALEALGGKDNLTYVTHCITRLRVSYKDEALVDTEALRHLPECAGLVKKDHSAQLIIGPDIKRAFDEFVAVADWNPDTDLRPGTAATGSVVPETGAPAGAATAAAGKQSPITAFSNFVAPVFMDIVPALSVGGMVLAVKTLLVNYFGVSTDSGTAQFLLCFFSAAFNYIPIYLGYSLCKKLNMQPILGMLLGGIMVCTRFQSGNVTDFFGIPVPQVDYTSSIIPIVLGVFFMWFVYRFVSKHMPQVITFFMTPLVTMLVSVPVTLIVLGPIGTELSGAVGVGVQWICDTLGFLAQPLLCVAYPYMVMLGLDKAWEPLQLQLLATLGYDAITGGVGFVSNLCIGASALAVATAQRDKSQRGLIASFGVTGLCGVTEPAFYGALIQRPRVLVGTAIGAASAGLFAGIFGLRAFIPTSCSGLLTFLQYLEPETGDLYYIVVSAITAAIAIVVSFVAVRVILTWDERHAAPAAPAGGTAVPAAPATKE